MLTAVIYPTSIHPGLSSFSPDSMSLSYYFLNISSSARYSQSALNTEFLREKSFPSHLRRSETRRFYRYNLMIWTAYIILAKITVASPCLQPRTKDHRWIASFYINSASWINTFMVLDVYSQPSACASPYRCLPMAIQTSGFELCTS